MIALFSAKTVKKVYSIAVSGIRVHEVVAVILQEDLGLQGPANTESAPKRPRASSMMWDRILQRLI